MYFHVCPLLTVPGRCICLPPHTRVAPSLTPVWQYSTSLSRWALWFCGPWSVERSSGSPVFIFLTSSTWKKRQQVLHIKTWMNKITSREMNKVTLGSFLFFRYMRHPAIWETSVVWEKEMRHIPLSSQTGHESFPPQTVCLLRCSSLLCWRRQSSYPETHTPTQ